MKFLRRNEGGAAAFEFAIIVPILVMILFAIFEFGLAYFRSQSLQAAAREGARIASLSPTTQTEINARVCVWGGTTCTAGALIGVPFASAPTITTVPNDVRPCNLRSGQTVRVTVSAPTTIEIPFFGTRTPTLTGAGEFLCE